MARQGDTEYADDLHAELGYRSAGAKEVRTREWFSLRGEPGEVAPTPKAFDKLIQSLRIKAWRARLSPERIEYFKAKVVQWNREHPEEMRRASARFYRKMRRDPKLWAARLESARKYAAASRRRRAIQRKSRASQLRDSVFECSICGAQFCVFRGPIRFHSACSPECITERRRVNNSVNNKARAEARIAALRAMVFVCSVCGVQWCALRRCRNGAVPSLCSPNCVAIEYRARRRLHRRRRRSGGVAVAAG